MKRLGIALALWASLCANAGAQLAGGLIFPGPGTPSAAGAAYTGPGDVFTTSPFAAYSCSRVFTAAQANTSTSLCDLVDSSAPTVVICTLRGSSTGKVDLSAYCPGSVTPAAKCAAATGAVCNISKAYDLTGNGRDVVASANQPTLLFSSSPTGTLPVINCGTSATMFLATSGTVTQAQPLSFSGVIIRTTGTAAGGAWGANTNVILGSQTGANLALVSSGSALTQAATDNQWFSLHGLLNGAASATNVNGSDNAGLGGGSTGLSGNNIRVCRANAAQLFGLIAEAYIWAAATNATDRGNVNSNQHGANGYSF